MAIKIRHILKQYQFLYQDNRLDKACNDLLAKTDSYLEINYKTELFKLYRKFLNPLMEKIHQEVVRGEFSDVFFNGYLATLTEDERSVLNEAN